MALALALVGLSGAALAGRHPDVLEQERKEEALALDYLVRKSDALSRSLVERRAHLRRRLRAMYKMSQGGYLRLLLGADSPTDLFARRNSAERILHRDIAELEAVREELGELEGLRERLRSSEQRSAALLQEAREAQHAGVGEQVKFAWPVGPSGRPPPPPPPPGMSSLMASMLARQAPPPPPPTAPARSGKIVQPFGPYVDAAGLEFSRDGVDLECKAGDPVFTIGPGAVRSAGEIPGRGMGVVIDHGDGWVSYLADLAEVRVRLGARVPAGFQVGRAAGSSVHLELSQGGTWVNPALFL